MTVTKQQVREFVQWASTRKSDDKDSKLKYALDKMLVRVRPFLIAINETWEDIDLNFANTDDKGVLIKDAQGGYTYTKDGEKERIQQRRAVMKETVEIKPFFVDQSLFEVSGIDAAFGTGFVFDLKENEDEADDTKIMRLDAKT